MSRYQTPPALQAANYDCWKLASPPEWENECPDFRCEVCGEWAEECECEDGPTEPEPYTREMYLADRADDLRSSGEM